MSRSNDRAYHEERARAELELAEAASDPAIARLHRELAALHKRQMMEVVDQPPPTSIEEPRRAS